MAQPKVNLNTDRNAGARSRIIHTDVAWKTSTKTIEVALFTYRAARFPLRNFSGRLINYQWYDIMSESTYPDNLVKRPVEVASPEGITVNMSLVLE
ncbi:predicted protein [Sclerotinia sclerotiorum 1980 UF-70]|uniref:Uncharacterized protein n=1 Tax=Sclerotinia sclerotiorum (strain ATCC 18683 / 1980 / Ss-1) TaxID=665079 RepID=A7E622_SCLS1|nr:predicted protein [Sclerotinia sclerotiorum 1980 UF-70]EDN91344.1 predicted protein [Sclerotinia sclerotiorum 1980 UF-70]